jgi:hypothetical protein
VAGDRAIRGASRTVAGERTTSSAGGVSTIIDGVTGSANGSCDK